MEQQSYTIDKHRHRFAAWASARAAQTGYRGRHFKGRGGFTVELAANLIKEIGLENIITSPAKLPALEDIDVWHHALRLDAIKVAERQGLEFSHGIAAKLINVYLKSAFICGGHHENERVQNLHPPIDGVLLDKLASKNKGNLGKRWNEVPWSKLTSGQYETIIKNIRLVMKDRPLWEIECDWRGYR